MGNIRRVIARVRTGDDDQAGTSGEVYLGLAGMEFKLNSAHEVDYEAGSDRTYILGDQSGTHPTSDAAQRDDFAYSHRNDPRITTVERAARHPIYVRLHPVDDQSDWLARAVSVTVEADDVPPESYEWGADPGRWLGCEYGLTIHLD